MKKIALFNQKGGCAKTTSVINIAGSLAKRGNRLLVVDCDPQANLTKALLMELDEEPTQSIVDVMNQTADINEVIVTAPIRTRGNANPKDIGIDILPTNRTMATISPESDYVLKEAIASVRKEYDYVIYDCPPYMSEFTVNILAASDYVLVPATVDADSLDGYGELIDTVSVLQAEGINPTLDILGVFLTIYTDRESFDRYIKVQSAETCGDYFFSQTIRRHTYAKQTRLFGRPLCYYKPKSAVANDYELLVDEMLNRM